MKQAARMGTEKISKLLMAFALPSVLSLVLHGVYNIVDRIFIGQGVGELGLAGVALSFPILLLIFGVCLLCSSGGAALISLKLGDEGKDAAERVLGNVVTLTTLIGIVVTFLGYLFCRDLLMFFNVSSDVIEHSYDYISTIFLGSILFLWGFSMTFIIRAEGNPIYATAMIVIATFINASLDYVFIFHLYMGTKGAALATVISEAFVALMGMSYFLRRKGLLHIRRKHLRLEKETVKRIAILGMSPAIMDVVACFQLSILNMQLIRYGGDQAVAAMGIIFAIASLIMLFTFGMAAGMQPIIGYNYGAKKYARVKEALLYTCATTVIVAGAFVVYLFVGANRVASLFCRDDQSLCILSSDGMKMFLCLIPFGSLSIIGARYFQAIGQGWRATFIGIARQLIIFIPLVLILPGFFGLQGIFLSGPLTDVLAVGLTCFMLFKSINKAPQM